jgi:hypothetical protein
MTMEMPLLLRPGMHGYLTPSPLYAFISWCLDKEVLLSRRKTLYDTTLIRRVGAQNVREVNINLQIVRLVR